MKSRFNKSIAFCLVLGMLAVICNGCSTTKSESTQSTIQPTVVNTETIEDVDENDVTEMTEAAKTPEQKAIWMYVDLLRSYPTILYDKDCEILGDLSFGYDDNLAEFGKHYDYFAVIDLNNDGIPELIANTIINNGWIPVSVFQYNESENTLQLLKDPLDPEAHATFEHMSTASGMYGLYVCKDNHLHSHWGGDTPIGYQEEDHAYVLNNEGLAAVDCAVGSADAVSFWDIERINDEDGRNSILDMYM